MKSIFYALLFTIVATSGFAQIKTESSKHLMFKGVPIDGTLDEFVLQMRKAGFTLQTTKDGIALMQGEFASYKSCYIGISTLKSKNLVNKIGVLFPDCDTWSALAGNYFNLKDMLTQKYGPPVESVEKFESSYSLDDDYSKMLEVKLDKCKYYTTYETEKGTIQLSIEKDKYTKCFVKLVYIDKTNNETAKKQAMDDL